jgi:cobalt-zinc-cadmium resistance protein CzcA
MEFLKTRCRGAARWAIEHRFVTVGAAGVGLAVAIYLTMGGVIGSEFLPHLDEGALWVRGALAPQHRTK